jgi:hypothetical protein
MHGYIRGAYRISVGIPVKERPLKVSGKFQCVTVYEGTEGE